MDLPYRAEYAKSGRASCRACKSSIEKESLRLAVLIQSPMFDGKAANWYHYHCFFTKQRPKTTDDIEHFESLRWEDQEKIKKKIADSTSAIIPTSGKGKKRGAPSASGALKDFSIEYAKSSRATCRGCEQKIMKEEIRISKKDFETEIGKKFGGQAMWHHVQCFAKLRSELAYFETADKLPGFNTLNKSDQNEVKAQIPAIKQEASDAKKLKTDDKKDPLEKEIKKQNKLFYEYRDNLKEDLSKSELESILEENEQSTPIGIDRILDAVADNMTFGRLLPCPTCSGQLKFSKGGYKCIGDLTEWTKCEKVYKEPERVKCKIPKELKSKYNFLKEYKSVVQIRKMKEVLPTSVAVKKDEPDGPKVHRERPRLYNMEFVLLGTLSKDKNLIKKEIVTLGGKISTKISDRVMAIISNKGEVEKMNSKMTTVKDLGIHVVPIEFLENAKESKDSIPDLIHKMTICDWGVDASKRIPPEPEASAISKSKSHSIYTSKVPSKVTLKLKGGNAVDPDSGLEDKAHVYNKGSDKYSVVLGITDIQKQKNSFYKLQLLEADKGGKYWLFRAWGRIGTTIGGNKLERMDTLHEAKTSFKDLYEEKTGNCWENRHDFMKVPGRMYPIDIDYGEDESKLEIQDEIPSKLPKQVQKLMHLIFDINIMKKVMLEFELDMEKMPLGKLSQSQMKKAFSVLSEAQQHVESNAERPYFVDVSNRFYTFIPHSAGMEELPLLDNNEIIMQKINMINNLMELEIAYSLMKESSNTGVDNHYDKLNTDIGVLDESSDEYQIIQEYIRNTHAPTHTNYELDIETVFTVKRAGEEKRFKPFRKLHNRRLLWHGSRVTNFAGILSQGLRIAPPEAPVTGYMFGKGIYFADMVSKSANYCCTSVDNSTGLLLLCDVALGEMYEKTEAKYIEKLPKGKHSCKGVGRTEPDPVNIKKIHDNIEVPIGKPSKSSVSKTSLLYNEFIVYDVAQVNVKYLVQLKFNYKF